MIIKLLKESTQIDNVKEEKEVCPHCGKEVCECNDTLAEAAEEVSTAEEQIAETPAEEPAPEITESAYTELLTKLVQDEWNLISYINSAISTFDYGYEAENKEDIVAILNQLIDDSTINIGMIYKVMELVSSKATDLISDGTEKAEEIIEEPAIEEPVDEALELFTVELYDLSGNLWDKIKASSREEAIDLGNAAVEEAAEAAGLGEDPDIVSFIVLDQAGNKVFDLYDEE